MPDAARAYRVLDLIDAHPEALDMETWVDDGNGDGGPVALEHLTGEEPRCGTTGCFAGWTAATEGMAVDSLGRLYRRNPDVGGWQLVTPAPDAVRWTATDLLGLDNEQAYQLFYDTADDQLHERVAEIFGPRPEAVDA